MDVGGAAISVEGAGCGLENGVIADVDIEGDKHVGIDDRVGEMEAARMLGVDDMACGASGI
jgi:hypothetical protein